MRGSAVFRAGVAPGGALAPSWVKDPLWTRARTKPSLDLQFASTKSLVDAVSGQNLITFTRASSGTYVGSDGLIKTATTNLLTYSEEFNNAIWQVTSPGEVTIISGVEDPLGGNTADTLYRDSGAGDTGWLRRLFSGVSGQTYTLSFWLRRRSGTGDFIAVIGDNINQVISGITSTWQRFSLSNTISSTTLRSYFLVNSPGDQFDIWGAQLEQSSTVGEYIPTTSTINSAPRFDHDPTTGESLGLLVEEQRTNSIRNNTMVGAVAGTPGTLPTNWSGLSTSNGLSRQIVGTGAEAGIDYIDIKISGTTTGAGSGTIVVSPETTTGVTAASGQNWTSAIYVKTQAGSIANISDLTHTLTERDATGILLASSSSSSQILNSLTGQWQRFTLTRALTNASTACVTNEIRLTYSSGVDIDITLRIGLPQLEQGAFATSVIPTTTATVTRSADVASITGTNFSSWYRQDEGTVFAQVVQAGPIGPSAFPRLAELSNGTGNEVNRLQRYSSGIYRPSVTDNGVTQAAFDTSPAIVVGATGKMSTAYALNDIAGCANGGSVVTDLAATIPTVDRLTIGDSGVPNPTTTNLNGALARLTFWPQRLSNSTLQDVTR